MVSKSMERPTMLTTRRNAWAVRETLRHLSDFDVKPKLFYGLDHKTTGVHSTIYSYDMDDHDTDRRLSPKSIHIQLSHYMLWSGLQMLGQDCYAIFEDDVRFVPGWKERMQEAIKSLPDDWDLLYLGSCNCLDSVSDDDRVGADLFRVDRASCLHAYVVRAKVLPVLLERCERVWAPVDLAMHVDTVPGGSRPIVSYAVLPRLAEQFNQHIPE